MDREHTAPPLTRMRSMAPGDRLLDVELTLYGHDGRSGITGLVRELAVEQSESRKSARLRRAQREAWTFRAAVALLLLVTVTLVFGKKAVLDALPWIVKLVI